jgi:starvation-inducible DNA-binding protein
MNAALFKTQNDLPEEARRAVIDVLNEHLTDSIDFGLQAKQAHWNVKGPNFVSLHALFDEVADSFSEFADDLAERAVQLGGVARGTLQAVSQGSRLKSYPLDLVQGCDHLQALSASLAVFGKSARSAIAATDRVGDVDTADLFTQISRATDKLLWKLEAHGVGA